MFMLNRESDKQCHIAIAHLQHIEFRRTKIFSKLTDKSRLQGNPSDKTRAVQEQGFHTIKLPKEGFNHQTTILNLSFDRFSMHLKFPFHRPFLLGHGHVKKFQCKVEAHPVIQHKIYHNVHT
ncbi:hypothetical protein ACF0H5_005837 [Mactra antiquata]